MTKSPANPLDSKPERATPISAFMTAHPHSIGRNQSLTVARRLMHEHNIRHLPVFEAGHMVGIVTERDITLIESMGGANPTSVSVEEAMNPEVYTVAPNAALGEVARVMADRKLGSAVVVDHDKVVGVFTTTDALHALTQSLTG